MDSNTLFDYLNTYQNNNIHLNLLHKNSNNNIIDNNNPSSFLRPTLNNLESNSNIIQQTNTHTNTHTNTNTNTQKNNSIMPIPDFRNTPRCLTPLNVDLGLGLTSNNDIKHSLQQQTFIKKEDDNEVVPPSANYLLSPYTQRNNNYNNNYNYNYNNHSISNSSDYDNTIKEKDYYVFNTPINSDDSLSPYQRDSLNSAFSAISVMSGNTSVNNDYSFNYNYNSNNNIEPIDLNFNLNENSILDYENSLNSKLQLNISLPSQFNNYIDRAFDSIKIKKEEDFDEFDDADDDIFDNENMNFVNDKFMNDIDEILSDKSFNDYPGIVVKKEENDDIKVKEETDDDIHLCDCDDSHSHSNLQSNTPQQSNEQETENSNNRITRSRNSSTVNSKNIRKNSTSNSKSMKNSTKTEKPFKCYECSSSFTRKTRLTEHINRVHLGKIYQYKCKECGTRLSSKENLTRHSIVHTDKFKCQNCNRRFDRSYRYQRHLEKCHV